ncbi:MAG: thiamine pyrophosphate-binding protein [Thermodesulfobacteriota bacterium]
MTRMRGSQAMIECLKTEGIRYLFGNPGTTEAAFLDALVEFPEITYVLTLQESVAVGMADGYTRGGGEIGVVSVHTAVGTANAIGGIYSASIAKSPVLMMIGNKDTRILGRNCFCEVPDLCGLTRQFTKWSWEVLKAEKIPEDLLRGIKIATTFPHGPVFLSFPEDLLKEEIEVGDLISTRPKSSLSFQGKEEDIQRAAQLLLGARNPLFIAGTEIARSNAFYDAVELAELLGLPVMTEGRDSLATLNFPHTHPQFKGVFDPKSPEARKADLILGIGCKLFVEMNFPPVPEIPKGAKIIHFHSDPHEIGKIYPEEISVLCDAKSGIGALLRSLRPLLTSEVNRVVETRVNQLKREKEKEEFENEKEVQAHWSEKPIRLPRLIRELNQVADRDAIIVDEAIRSSRSLLKYYRFEIPGTYVRSSAGALGWGVPGALGVKLANPKRQVIAVVGDGSFLFSIQSLWTAAKYRIPVVVVVCNNRQYQAVKEACKLYQGVSARSGSFVACDLKEPDIEFCHLAEGFGVWARKVVEPEEVGPGLREALTLGKPAVLDVRIA